MNASYIDKNNPNFKNAGLKKCFCCGNQYHNYQKTSKYCSHNCYVEHQKNRIVEMSNDANKKSIEKRKLQPKINGIKNKCVICNCEFRLKNKSKYCANHKKEAKENQKIKPKKTKSLIKTNCLHCKKDFEHYKSQNRIFCSYKCFLDSGGAWRAGMAASEATMKYGLKKDANHNEIVEALKIVGASVIDMSSVGNGFPDLIVGFRSQTLLMEIKNPKTGYGKRGLNKNQQKWKEYWLGGSFCVVDSVDSALRAIGVLKNGNQSV